MNTIIIEDEKPSARRLQRMLAKKGITVNRMLHSVEESVAWFKKNPFPDLVFLDVQLGDGLSFEIFEEVEANSPIIFTTAYEAYALRAFKLNSIDYLLKPIDEAELSEAIEKYRALGPAGSIDLTALKNLLSDDNPQGNTYKTRFSAKVGERYKVFPVDGIVCFFSENKGTYLQNENGRHYLLDTTLEKIETELDPQKFFRANRKFIVNIEFIVDIVQYSNSRLKVEIDRFDQASIIVSRERTKDFKQWLES